MIPSRSLLVLVIVEPDVARIIEYLDRKLSNVSATVGHAQYRLLKGRTQKNSNYGLRILISMVLKEG